MTPGRRASGPGGARPWRLRGGAVGYGGDYNPEQWSRDVWDEDVRLMRSSGVNLVTLGVFSWAKVEPRPGEFDFAWLDEVIALLYENGIAVDLATMSASPPPWFSLLHPEALPVREDGARLWHGSRRHYCPSSPAYRERVRLLVDRLARRYGRHPAVVLWHVDNEFTGGVPECFCPGSVEHFRSWLQDRYGSVDRLNEAWSTTFWSQQYSAFEEVVAPRPVPAIPNPAASLDFARFMSVAYQECFQLQADILRRHSPDVPVTTNLLMMPRAMDLHASAGDWDVSSIDVYADPLAPDAHRRAAFSYDVCRGLRRGEPWLLMEQAAGAVNWRARCAPKPPGMMRNQSLQAVAHGADAVLFFQWRQSRGGAEKFHSAMLPHTGPDSRTHREVRALGAELETLGDVVGSRVLADVALLMDWENWWAVELPSHPSAHLDYLAELRRWHAASMDLGLVVDVVHPGADLSGYAMVLAPHLYLTTAPVTDSLSSYVESGGRLVVGPFSGVVDESDRLHPGGMNAGLSAVLGTRVEEFWPLPEAGSVGLRLGGQELRAREWTEELSIEDADVVAEFTEGDLAGRPALTRATRGHGAAWYLGAVLDAPDLRVVLGAVAGEHPLLAGRLGSVPDQVSVVRRLSPEALFTFVLNHGPSETTVTVGQEVVQLSGRDVRVLREPVPPAEADRGTASGRLALSDSRMSDLLHGA